MFELEALLIVRGINLCPVLEILVTQPASRIIVLVPISEHGNSSLDVWNVASIIAYFLYFCSRR